MGGDPAAPSSGLEDGPPADEAAPATANDTAEAVLASRASSAEVRGDEVCDEAADEPALGTRMRAGEALGSAMAGMGRLEADTCACRWAAVAAAAAAALRPLPVVPVCE
jgi:hypothetical protein